MRTLLPVKQEILKNLSLFLPAVVAMNEQMVGSPRRRDMVGMLGPFDGDALACNR